MIILYNNLLQSAKEIYLASLTNRNNSKYASKLAAKILMKITNRNSIRYKETLFILINKFQSN